MQSALPIQQKERTVIVDVLRGWALLGVVLMNYVDHYLLGLNVTTDFKPSVAQIAVFVVFAAKSWTLLSLLFGYGFSALMENIKAKGLNTNWFFTKRMFWLLVLAAINSAFFFGDILKDYAVMGMLLLLVQRFSAKVCFIISLVLIFAIPIVSALVNSMGQPGGFELMKQDIYLYESANLLNVFWFGWVGTYKFEFLTPTYLITVHVVMLGCFMLGVAAQKINFFGRLTENKKYVKRIFWFSLSGIVFIGLAFAIMEALKVSFRKYYSPEFLFLLVQMIFIASAVCWLYVAGKLKALFRWFSVIGKMTLTNYITQNMLAIVLFSGAGFGLAGSGRIQFEYYLLFALTVYVSQIYFSKWWLKKYNYGPLEWIWRQLSYGKKLPLKKDTSVDEVIVPGMVVPEVMPVQKEL